MPAVAGARNADLTDARYDGTTDWTLGSEAPAEAMHDDAND